MATGFLSHARSCHLNAVAKVIVAERSEDGPQGIGFVTKRRRTGREDALAGRAAPELNDLEFLLAHSAARKIVAGAIGACVGYFGSVGNAHDAW
jgi:hypothetical protein